MLEQFDRRELLRDARRLRGDDVQEVRLEDGGLAVPEAADVWTEIMSHHVKQKSLNSRRVVDV